MVVEEESLELSELGSITGVIYLAFDRSGFPDMNWSDFPVVILSWWLGSAETLLDEGSIGTDFRFMDGPFLLETVRAGRGSVRLNCVRDASNKQVLVSLQTTAAEFTAELLHAAKMLERTCLERGWRTEDTLALSRSIAALERRIAASKPS